MEEQIALHRELVAVDAAKVRAELGLRQDSVVLLYVGRLYKEKRVGELLDAARAIEDDLAVEPPVEVVILGDGPELERLKTHAAGLGNVHFVGKVEDQLRVAHYMRVATAVVMPGKAGLAVNHAFAQGVPVITRESRLHAPEVDYIESGRNGLIVTGDLTAFTRALAEFATSPQQQEALAAGALRTREALSMDEMARAFDEGVRRVLTGRADTPRRPGPVPGLGGPPRYTDSSSGAGADSTGIAAEARGGCPETSAR
jgi:glycosyltransferase involved in cell wall biosynthesis